MAEKTDGGFCRSAYEFVCRLTDSRYFLPICLAVALALRLIWFLSIHNRQISDFSLYTQWGRDIAAGHGFTRNGHPTAYYPIGYPIFLGLIFHVFHQSMLAAKAANAVLYVGIILLAFLLAKELFHSRFVAGVTAVMLAIEPNHIFYTSILLSETLFTFLMLLGAWLLLRWKDIAWAVFAAGLVFGMANLVRPLSSIVMLVVFAVVCWGCRGALRGRRIAYLFVLLCFGHGMAILPYGIRNSIAMHRFSVVSLNSGINMVLGNNPYANGTYPNDQSVCQKVMALVKPSRDEFTYNESLNHYAAGYILSHPLETMKLWPRKIAYLYAFEVDGLNRNIDGLKSGSRLRPLMVLSQGCYMLLAIGCIGAICLHLRRRGGGLPVLGLWLLITWTVIHMIVLGSSRYHYPMIPWIGMYAAAMLQYIATGSFRSPRVESATVQDKRDLQPVS